MAWQLTINGADRTDDVTSASINLMLNEPSTAQIGLELPDGDDLPVRFQELVSYAKDGTTPLFGGVIRIRAVEGIDRTLPNLAVTLECMDFWFYADESVVSLSYDDPVTLKQVLTDIVDEVLDEYGISLDAGQVDGPTLAPFSWTLMRTSDALRELSQRSPGYIVRISPTKELSASILGLDTAPFAITDDATHAQECNWRDSDRTPKNKIILVCGPTGEFSVTQQWVSTGSDTSWEVDIQSAVPGATIGSVTLDGVTKTVGSGAYFDWDPSTGRGTLVLDAGAQPTVGQVIEMIYTAVGPFTIIEATGASPILVHTESRPEVVVYGQGVEIAEGLLAALDQSPRDVDILTDEDGLSPAQSLTVDLDHRAITAATLINGVTIDLVFDPDSGDAYWEYRAIAPEAETYQGSHLALWREVVGGSGSSVVSGGVGGGGGTSVLASPFFLGGSRNTAIVKATAAWTPVVNYLEFVASASFTGRVRVDLKADSGVGVTARLLDVTAATSEESSEVTSTSFVPETFISAIVAGHTYRLEIISDTNNAGIFGIGTLEAA